MAREFHPGLVANGFDMQLGAAIKRLRRRQQRSLAQTAEIAGIQDEMVKAVERGSVRISAAMLQRLAKALGVSTTDIIREADHPDTKA